MREILFRGKEKDTNEWVYGYLLADTADCSLKKEGKCSCAHDGSICWILEWDDAFHEYAEKEIIPETVGQYTGLNDKNGKKIFEGDIVRYPERLLDGKDCFCINLVSFYEGGFSVSKYFLNNWLYNGANGNIQLDNIEVIGNFHDQKDYDKKGDE